MVRVMENVEINSIDVRFYTVMADPEIWAEL